MFGTLRLLLSLGVVSSHLSIPLLPFYLGASSVVVFYVLSGYLMSWLWSQKYLNKSSNILFYYLDRVLRIFPVYLVILAMSMVFIYSLRIHDPEFSLSKILLNSLIIPTNYNGYLWDISIFGTSGSSIIPVAWSLGLEMQFYILLPLLLLMRGRNPRYFDFVFLASFVVYELSLFKIINPVAYGYRLLPGVLFMFMLGTYMYEAIENKTSERVIKIVWMMLLLNMGVIEYFDLISPYNIETLIGLLVGIPLIMHLSSYSHLQPLDMFFGAISYGVFLSHYLFIWIFGNMGIADRFGMGAFNVLVILITLLFSITLKYVVERPSERFRKRLRASLLS